MVSDHRIFLKPICTQAYVACVGLKVHFKIKVYIFAQRSLFLTQLTFFSLTEVPELVKILSVMKD